MATRDRLSKWGITRDNHCVLRTNGIETHEQIFFTCLVSLLVWQEVLTLNNISRSPLGWKNEITWAMKFRSGKSLIDCLYKLSLAATTVFSVWREKNSRIFRSCGVNATVVAGKIKEEIRARLWSWKMQESDEAKRIWQIWKIPFKSSHV